MTFTLSEDMNTNAPTTADIAVTFAGTSVAVNSVNVSSSGIDVNDVWLVGLAAYAAPGETVSVTYTKPSSNPPQDTAGNDLASFTRSPVSNLSAWSSVTINAAYTSSAGNAIAVNFSAQMQTPPQPDVDRFSATVDGVAANLERVLLRNAGSLGSKGQLVLFLAERVQEWQTVTVSYNRLTGAANALRDGYTTSRLLQSFTRGVENGVGQPTPTIDLVRIVSAPTYDADSDGVRDTYVRGDKIVVDVEYSVPVSVTRTPRLRLQLGADGNTGAPVVANRKQVNFESELHGGKTLRFGYTVVGANTDSDGVWIETAGTSKQVVFLPSGAAIKSTLSREDAELTRTGLPTTGNALAKVDGTKTSSDRGPLPTGATVNGSRLEVTFDKTLDTSVDTSDLPLYFSVYGTELSGGHRNAYQHPSTVSFATGDSTKLVLTLGEAARAGDTVKLNYTLIDHTGLLKDSDDKVAPAFFDLAVTNNTAGTAGPAPSRASVRARTLRLVFDGDLDEASTPAGSAFLVETEDRDDDKRSIAGTGTATVAGATVTVALDANEEPVGPDDLVLVSYTPPTSSPLQNAGGDDVLRFERFRVETVLDGIPPAFVGGEAMQTSTTPATSKVIIYYDEPLNTTSVPGTADFSVIIDGMTAVVPSSVAVEGDAVTLTLSQALTGGSVVSLGHAPGTNKILDLAGNPAKGFTHAITASTAAAPVLQTSGTDAPAVDGASLTLTYNLPLNPAKVPGADRYTLHYQLASGETDREEYAVDVAAVAVRQKKIVLQLSTPVFPCSPEPTVSYAQESGGTNVEGIDGTDAAAISHQVVTNKRKSGCTRARGVSGNSGGQGKSFALKFQRTLDTVRALQASAFRLVGASAPSVAGAAYTADAAGVALTLNRALAPGQTVEARYERPVDEPGLWDTDGKQIADFSGVTVTNEKPAAPAVTGVEVVSEADEDDTYGLGEAIRIRLTFSEAVDVTGAPRLKIDMDPAHWGEKWVAYQSGGGTDSLTFSHTVVEPNISTKGIAVLANTLQANGGAIRSAETQADAELAHVGLGHDPAHKVDWQKSAPAAELPSVSVSDARAAEGEAVEFTVSLSETSDEQVTVDYATSDGTAESGTDFTAASGTLTFAANDTSETVRVETADDSADEEDETFTLTLSNPAGATLNDAEATGTIADDDVEPGQNSPATGAPAISGTAQAGETLTASTEGIADADGLSGATFGFQWVSSADGSDTDISGATGRSYTLADSDVGATIKVRASFTDDAGNGEARTSAATARVEPRPLTAAFEGMPAEHDGVRLFNFDLVFSENFPGKFPYTTLRDSAFTVTNGRVRGAERVVKGENRRWRLKVRPSSNDDLTITLAAGAVSTESGRPLANTVSATVAGPVGVSVADARVKEAAGAALAFAVTLSRTATSAFSVDYATSDGTAQAGADYTAASGTLSFQAGDSSKTIEVSVLDDAHDEGEETLTLRLSNASGAWLSDGEATGTIENTDLMPAALLARFGRATAEQVVTHIEERMAAPRQRGFRARFAGQELRPGQERDFALGLMSQFAQPMGMGPAGAAPLGGAVQTAMGSHAAGRGGMGMPGMSGAMSVNGMGGVTGVSGPGAMGMTGQHAPMGGAVGMDGYAPAGGAHGDGLFGSMLGYDPLANSEFELNRESRGGVLSMWSRSSRSHFSGTEDALSLNGDVRTTMVGADWARGPLTVGLSVGRTLGMGGYSGPSGGQMTTSMTGFYPWVGYQVNDRVSVWGTSGYGTGALSLTPDGQSALETGVSMAMSAVGTRGELVGSRATGGFALAYKADALWVGAASELLDGPTGRLNASEAGVTRVRTALEGSRGFILGGGRLSLTPSVEVGLRRDGGDAETGAGMDVGGGLAFTDAVTGLSLDVRVRTLVVHQADGFSDRGMSLSFGWDPTPSSPLGLTAKVAPSWGGSARGGAEALWGNQMTYGMGSHQMYGSGDRVDAEVGYGLPLGARFVGTPRVGLATSQYGRDYRFGYGLGVLEQGKVNFELGVDAQRRESATAGGASNGLLGRATLGW